MGNTCKPMAVSFQCMTKSTTNKKKKERKGMFAMTTAFSWQNSVSCCPASFCTPSIIIRQHILIYNNVLRFITLISTILIFFYVLTCLSVLLSFFISFIEIDKVLYFPFVGVCHRLYIYSFSN